MRLRSAATMNFDIELLNFDKSISTMKESIKDPWTKSTELPTFTVLLFPDIQPTNRLIALFF